MPLRPSSKSYAMRREPEERFSSGIAILEPQLRSNDNDNETEKPPMAYLPYVAGVSEKIRKVRRENVQNMKTVPTTHSFLASYASSTWAGKVPQTSQLRLYVNRRGRYHLYCMRARVRGRAHAFEFERVYVLMTSMSGQSIPCTSLRSRACHITFPTVFVWRYTALDTLSPSIICKGTKSCIYIHVTVAIYGVAHS